MFFLTRLRHSVFLVSLTCGSSVCGISAITGQNCSLIFLN
ncbi:hypothetical protein X975_04522, partial [Stegodyphus mimosarum]